MLGGAAVVLAAVMTAGTLVEGRAPESASSADLGWSRLPGVSPSATSTAAAAARYVFPVDGKATYAQTHHDYPASDIISPCGSPVLAVTDGVVLEVSREDGYDKNADDGALRGGLFISLLGDDGVRYYGSHLRSLLPAVNAGLRVTAGQPLGEVGDTGDAGVCHLHFGISPPCAATADWWTRRGVIWPYSYLDAWRAGQPKSPLPEITTWQQTNTCPPAPL